MSPIISTGTLQTGVAGRRASFFMPVDFTGWGARFVIGRKQPKRRFTILTLLVLTGLSAAVAGYWKAFIDEPPTHKISAYERAMPWHSTTAQVGPNRVTIELIARNDRDGSISIEDGRGHNLSKRQPQRLLALTQAAAWLDVVQVELSPDMDALDILEIRVFDHARRQLLSEIDGLYGWRLLPGNILELYGLGRRLPDELDLWFRAHSYPKDDPVSLLSPTGGGAVALPGGSLVVSDIRPGTWDADSSVGFTKGHGQTKTDTSAIFEFRGNWQAGRYQIYAVTRERRKSHPSFPHFLDCSVGGSWHAISFDLPMEDILHFELRPFGGRHRVLFEAVKLPKLTGGTFKSPPAATAQITGQEINETLPQFHPLEVRVSTHRGIVANGTYTNGMHAGVIQSDQVIDADTATTFQYHVLGVHDIPWQFLFQESASGQWLPETGLAGGRSGRGAASACGAHVGFLYFNTPLERIEAVELTIPSL